MNLSLTSSFKDPLHSDMKNSVKLEVEFKNIF